MTNTHLILFRLARAGSAFLGLLALTAASLASAQSFRGDFRRIATFPVVLNTCAGQPADCLDTETVSEIIAASRDGRTVIYTDAETGNIGFVDISDPANPQPGGFVETPGEPTSVAVASGYALAAINTSADFVMTSGELLVIDIATHEVVRTIQLDGQPDSVAVSPNGRYAAIVIENERNEDLCIGGTLNGQEVDEDECEEAGGELGIPGQAPAGFLTVLDMTGRGPASWSTRTIALTGLADKFPGDPEPEYVDINYANQAVVTLQENNYLIVIHLPTGRILDHFSAGKVDLTQIDTEEEDVIRLNSSLDDVPREADAVTWISNHEFATADEGDLDGGSRGFTIYRSNGAVRFSSGNFLEHLAVRIGHYPEDRSGNKGTEPEGIEYGLYGNRRLLFVASERGSFVAVYEVPPIGAPRFLQVLAGGAGPEGLLAIPSRNLFVTASEVDDRGDVLRSAITIYELGNKSNYPTIVSLNRPDRTPIPWGALSGLAADPSAPGIVYTVHDSFYDESRIYRMDVSQAPAVIMQEIVLHDGGGGTFNFDPEGIALRSGGGFWIASEGRDSCDSPGVCDLRRSNLIVEVDPFGLVLNEISLPQSVADIQRNNGFEGIASVGSGDSEVLFVAFQREWNLFDPAGWARIGRYEVASGDWTFYYYPIDPATSPNGGWVGLSELTALGGGRFAVIERDNQGNIDATIKKLYTFSTGGVTPLPQESLPNDPSDPAFPALTKTLARDILPDLQAPRGLVIEKVEGLAVMPNGDTLIVTDNDGVDDSSGETQLINLGPVF